MSLRPALALLTVALAWPFAAHARAETYPVGSPTWNAAIEASVAHWGSLPCGGTVEFSWTALPAGVMGYASWMRSGLAPSDSTRFTTCRVDLNPEMDLGPEMFCTTLAHELGHLHGHEHVDDPGNLMAASIGEPLPACEAAMAPLRPTVVAATAEPAAAHAAEAAPAPVAAPGAPKRGKAKHGKRRRNAKARSNARSNARREARRAARRG